MENHVETCSHKGDCGALSRRRQGAGARCVARGLRNGVDREPANGGPRGHAQRVPSPNMATSGVEAWHSKDLVHPWYQNPRTTESESEGSPS